MKRTSRTNYIQLYIIPQSNVRIQYKNTLAADFFAIFAAGEKLCHYCYTSRSMLANYSGFHYNKTDEKSF